MTNQDKNDLFDYLIAQEITNGLGPVAGIINSFIWGLWIVGAGILLFSGIGSLLSIF